MRIPGRYVPSGIVRYVFRRPCREPFCNERKRCWRWHVETFHCPTCGYEVDEFDRSDVADQIHRALFPRY